MTEATGPLAYLLQHAPLLVDEPALRAYEQWWHDEGLAISASIDRAGTPALRRYDLHGQRVDQPLYPPGYQTLLQRGYQAGAVACAFDDPPALLGCFQAGYVASYFDPGIYCPYTVTLGTAAPLAKYGSTELIDRYLPRLTRRERPWQGATWMTEIRGGSDLGANVDTVAEGQGDQWRLNGEKFFCSNIGAELAVVAARPREAPKGIRGLALFLVPRLKGDGRLNMQVQRLKDKTGTRSVPTGEVALVDSEGWLLGSPEQGIYTIMEVLNLSRVANSIAAVALMQRAIELAEAFTASRVAFGRPLNEQPLMRTQLAGQRRALAAASAIAWEAATALQRVWQQRPPYAPDFHQFRLIAHLAKYWTAEQAALSAKWCMEVHGGLGVLAEHGIERLFREAMVLAIWEGAPHRQVLDGIEVMARYSAHKPLLEQLSGQMDSDQYQGLSSAIETLLKQDSEARQAAAEPVFRQLAQALASALSTGPP